jgi:uncharacterized protein YdeI (YjbR/CyaY-like superfamily)
MEPIHFPDAAAFRAWLEEHHETETEVFVLYYKKATGKPSMTWSQAVDQALCFGWIDGWLKSLGPESHMQRFTPRKPGSNWSKINIAKVAALTEAGLMRPAGQRAFEARREDRSGVYSFEQDTPLVLSPEYEARIRAVPDAWAYWEKRPPGYRRTATHWVMSAKREETREKRLAQLIESSAAGEHVPHLKRP